MSRRTFLGLSSASLAASVVPADLEKDFSVERAGQILHIVTDNVVRWTIDPAIFGRRASVSVQRDDSRTEIWLRNALFPATALPASFHCTVQRAGGRWIMSLRTDAGTVGADWLDWLHQREPATGRWRLGVLRPMRGFSLSSSSPSFVRFTPDWVTTIQGHARASLAKLDQELEVASWSLHVNHAERLAANDTDGPASTFILQRGQADWPINVGRVSEAAWSLAHDIEENLFDELRVEALQASPRPMLTALLKQAEDNRSKLRFFTGGGFYDSGGDPFHMPLHSARVAFSLERGKSKSALLADFSHQETWAHADTLSVAFSGTSSSAPFVLLDDGIGPTVPRAAPAVVAVQCPSDQDCTIKLNFDQPRPTSFNWAKFVQPFEDGLSNIHLLGGEHRLSFDLSCGDVLSVIRPTDMLKLDFEFQNVRLVTGFWRQEIEPGKPNEKNKPDPLNPPLVGETGLQPGGTTCTDGECLPPTRTDKTGKAVLNCPQLQCASGGTPRVTVTFPPQHVQEQAFFHSDDDFDKPDVVQKFKKPKVGSIEVNHRSGASPGDIDPDAENNGGNAPGTQAPDTVPANAILSGESNLVFDLDQLDKHHIPFNLENLLNWANWKPVVAVTASQLNQPNPDPKAANFNLYPDKATTTSIELPYRLFLSPHQDGRWAHAPLPVVGTKSQAVELWHTRLAVKQGADGIDETNTKDRTARAIYTPDLKPGQMTGDALDLHQGAINPKTEKRYPLDSRDREEIVFLTSDFGATTGNPKDKTPPKPYNPLPIQLDHLILTPLGGYLKSIGAWDPPAIDFASGARTVLTVEQWKHVATLGRDHYVRVVYKGYLAPFSHRASLVKVTERKFVSIAGNDYAILHQRMYLVVQQTRRDFPLYRQPNNGRHFPFQRVDVLTTKTPDLDDPNMALAPTLGAPPSISGTQSLFWPAVNRAPFLFRFRFWDMENNISEASLPVVFGDASISQDIAGCRQMVALYNAGSGASRPDDSWVCTPFNRQSIAFAPSNKPGDTRYDAATLCWKIQLDDVSDPKLPHLAFFTPPPLQAVADDLYFHNLPLFYPELDEAKVSSASIQRITGDSTPKLVKIYPEYIKSGYDPKVNPGEVVLQVTDSNGPVLAFGGANGKTDQAGGLSSPDMRVVGFSRKSGAVGGTPSSSPTGQSSLSVYSKGTFSPADFFGGLTSAKLLGAVKLSDILQPLLGSLDTNLGDAPRMVEQMVFDLAGDAKKLEDPVVEAIKTIQGFNDPLTPRLAGQAQAVYAAQDVRNKTDPSQTLDVALAHASLIQAILAYGDAVKTQLQDPALLLSEAAMDLLSGLIAGPQFQSLLKTLTDAISSVGATLGQLSTSADAILSALSNLQAVLGDSTHPSSPIADPLPFPAAIVDRTQVELRQLIPEINALLDLLPVCKDLKSNITQLIQTPVAQNLPGAIGRLGLIAKDLLALQQGLGVLGISIPTPDLLTKAKDIQTKLTSIWDSVDAAAAVAATKVMSDLQDACFVLASQPAYQDGPQVLQNLRQIQRTIGHIDDLRRSLGAPPDPSLTDPKCAYRWLQRLQQLQRQVIESANALQKTATAVLSGPDALANAASSADLQTAAVNLLTVIVSQADGKALIEKITCFDNLLILPAAPGGPSTKAVEDLVNPILGSFQDPNHNSREINSSVSAQLASLRQALNSARASLTNITPQQSLTTYLAQKANLAAIFGNAASTPAQKAAAQQAVVDAIGALEQISAAHLQVYDLAVRYQNCVTSIVSWSLFVQDKVTKATNDALTTLADNVNKLGGPLQQALTAIHDAGATIFTFVSTSTELGPLLANVCAPLNALPNPPAGTPLSQLLDDTRSVMADVSAVVDNVQNSVRLVTDEVKSLVNIKSLPALIAKLPIPNKISFSYTWHPKIKSFEPVFLLDPGADFSITAKFEDNVFDLSHPTFNITAQLTNFSINLIGSPSFVIVKASKLVFTSANGNKPDCRLTINSVAFGEDMKFAQSLASLLNPQNGPFIEFYGLGIRAGFRFQIPTITMGAFTMMQLALEVAVQLSFDGSPLRCQIGISDQTHPFLLSAGIYGGGGFLQLQLGLDGVELLQGALEFGVVAAISIGPVEGSGYVVAGIYFQIGGNASKVCGFVHAHGHMDIFGLISMDIDVYVSLCYQGGVVQGLATFSVSVSILFFSESFTMQASYQFSGSSQGGSSGGSPDGDGNAYLHYYDNPQLNSEPSLLAESESFISPEDWVEHFAAFAA